MASRSERVTLTLPPEMVEVIKRAGYKPATLGYQLLRDFLVRRGLMTPAQLTAMERKKN